MRKYKFICCLLLVCCFSGHAQSKKVKVLLSLNDAYERVIQDGKYFNPDTVYFEKAKGKKLYFFDNKIYLNDKKIYCFDNVQYYEDLVYMEVDKTKYLYIYPHYINREGPYIYYELGVLIKPCKKTVIKENIDYYDSSELYRIFESKKGKKRSLKEQSCADGHLD